MTEGGTGERADPPQPGPASASSAPPDPVVASDGYRPARASADRPVIAVDAMGGDHAPAAIVAGAVAAYRQGGIGVVLVGRPGQVRPLLAEHGVIGQVRLVAAEDSVAMDEGALASWRRPRSSIAVACQLVHLRPGDRGGVGGLDSGGRVDRPAAAAQRRRACCDPRSRSRCRPSRTRPC